MKVDKFDTFSPKSETNIEIESSKLISDIMHVPHLPCHAMPIFKHKRLSKLFAEPNPNPIPYTTHQTRQKQRIE